VSDHARTDGKNVGRIVEVKGVVLDAVFTEQLPEIYNALEIEISRGDDATETLVA
jgi:F-type H+-transporting ATPase subunit beta